MNRPMVAGLIVKNHKLLLVHNTKHNSLRIEPPGGKVESDESLEAATIRELNEELGIRVAIDKVFGTYKTVSPEGNFNVSMYICRIISGNPRILEPEVISNFAWYSYSQIEDFAKSGNLVPNLVKALPDIKKLLN